MLCDQAASLNHNIEAVRVICCGSALGGLRAILGPPCFDEPVSKVATGGNKDGSRPDGWVANLEVENFG